MARVTAVGLGPAGQDLRPPAAERLLFGPAPVFLRTRRHPAAADLTGAADFDHLYQAADSFEQVYRAIVDELVIQASASAAPSGVVYAVPGSPLVAERTVELLRADPRVELTAVPALSFVDLAWARLGVDPMEDSVRLLDGTRFAAQAAGERGPLLVGQCWSKAVLSEIKLALDLDHLPGPAPQATLLHHLGLPDERLEVVAWADLDRSLEPDHLTALWVPALAAPVAGELRALDELVHILRARCPWDRQQTHASLTRHLLEEAHEVIEAIDELTTAESTDNEAEAVDHLEEELGDLLFQVYFHSCLAAEEGRFTLADVARRVHDKLVARHPHVFGDVQAVTAGAVAANWEQIKKAEKGRTSVTEGIPVGLPALARAAKLQRKARAVEGYAAPTAAVARREAIERLEALGRTGGPGEGVAAPSDDETLGELLWAVTDVVRQAGAEPEDVLRLATQRFGDRLRALES